MIRKNTIRFLLSLTVLLLHESGFAQADQAKLRILASFYPMQIAVLNVAKDVPGVQVSCMVKPFMGCLHDYQLSTDDMTKIANADLFVVNGAGMESFLDKVVKQMPKLKIVNASTGIEFIKDKNGEPNPHVWVSVSNAIRQAQNIAEGLALADPAHAEDYKKNADTYIRKLELLRTKMHEGLKDIKNRKIITFHEAFPYFAKEFGLELAAVIEREPGSEPNARELAETIKIIRKNEVKALFSEPQYPAKSAEAIVRETGATLYVLDPAVTGPAKADAYLEIMEKNLETLQKALR
ncbi:MAG: metal ABC transporter substrate-binding protein [Lentisphaerae bacterium GWF2_52_8]|nr:MAG: metal ABC transporter substrate-binding protein [Lentisphaerae bacterium GWF2_52_8]